MKPRANELDRSRGRARESDPGSGGRPGRESRRVRDRGSDGERGHEPAKRAGAPRREGTQRHDGHASPLRAAEQDVPEPERPVTPDELAGQSIEDLEEPPQAEGPREPD